VNNCGVQFIRGLEGRAGPMLPAVACGRSKKIVQISGSNKEREHHATRD
jgi:hypothetical protein